MNGTVSYSQLGSMGRLGNMLFQVSATIAYAAKHNKIAAFPEWKYSKYFKNNLINGSDISFKVECTPDKVYNEPSFNYNEIPQMDGDFDIHGYMQSYKYFENIIVKDLFELKPEYQSRVDEIYKKINPKFLRTCGVHVRRGDYLNEAQLAYHGVLGMDYYNAAAEFLYPKGFKDVLFVICSDDIAWCKENFKAPNMYFSEGQEDIIDLKLMSLCGDHIIANSSFSWWAAHLGQKHHQRVVATSKWFAGANLDTKDLYLPEWIKI